MCSAAPPESRRPADQAAGTVASTADRHELRAAAVKAVGESPSGKAPDFDSGIRRFDPYLPSQFLTAWLKTIP